MNRFGKINSLATIALLAFFAAAAAEAAESYIRCKKAFGKNYVHFNDVAKYYGMDAKPGDKTCCISKNKSSVSITYDKRKGSMNGVIVHFLHAPARVDGIPLLSQQDFQLVVDPIIRPWALPRKKVKTILIDPGHGGGDFGAEGDRFREKDLNLQIASRIQSYLKSKGFNAILTRSSDKSVSLTSRAAMSKNADLFVSIHCNAVSDKSVSGVETFALTPYGASSTKDTKTSKDSFSGNAFDKQNSRLAYLVQRYVIAGTNGDDRGIKHDRFAVLKGAKCPAVLIETGFISNKTEEKNLASPTYQAKLAKAIADSLAHFAKDTAP